MRDVAPSSGRPKLDKPRARKAAARALGIALQSRYRRLLEASGDDETVVATADLAQTMYENIEFVIWGLKSLGGMNPPPPEQLRKITMPPQSQPANDDPRFAKPLPFELQEEIEGMPCTCSPLEHGIIGRDKHMTSCPKYVP